MVVDVIRRVPVSECVSIIEVINDAAQAYNGVIPKGMLKDPYMKAEELRGEVEQGVKFYGWFENGSLLGVMGIQAVKDVTLIRHAYVRTSCQRRGLGKILLKHLLGLVQTREVLVGTWAAAWWAIQFYEKNGFKLVPEESLSKLRQYWTIPDGQAESSVVLKQVLRKKKLVPENLSKPCKKTPVFKQEMNLESNN